MLSDRSYMPRDASRRGPGFLVWFLGALAGVFVLQSVFKGVFSSFAPFDYGALSSTGLRHGEFWTPLTYALLHSNPAHLLLNCLGLFFIGRALQDALGSVRLARLTVVGALGAAAAWLAINFIRPGNVIGASGIAMAYLAVFACLYPRRPMTMLLFFIIPVTIQPVWLVAIIGGIDVLGLVFQEIPGDRSLYGVAHSAHLGGLLAGWLFHRLILARPRGLAGSGAAIEPPAWFGKKTARPAPAYTVNLGPAPAAKAPPSTPADRDALRAEVNRILDKINLHGFGSLTPTEKHSLDQARQHLSHR